MRFIPTRVHGMMDYAMGLLLIAAPFLLNFDKEGGETWVPVTLGVAALLYSLFTDYELGAVRQIPMPVHLGLDLASGVMLAASPWLCNFDERVYLPHLILGIVEVVAALTTHTVPTTRRTGVAVG